MQMNTAVNDLDVTTQIARTEALDDGTTLQNGEFTITRKIGSGGFGITYLAKDNSLQRDVVIKECFPEPFCLRDGKSVLVRSSASHEKYRNIIKMFLREARSIAKIRHPNVINVHRIFEDNSTAYMVLDLVDGNDLQSLITHQPEILKPQMVRDILTKLLDAVDRIHSEDVLHRDISPDNILLDRWGNPILIDFGAARQEASSESRALSAVLVVKDGYSPQEFYFSGGKQSACSDLYALASSFYHVIADEPPVNSQTRMSEIATGNPDPCLPLAGQFDDLYDRNFLEAIDRAMRVLPKERLQSAQEWLKLIAPANAAAAGHAPKMMTDKPPEDLQRKLTRMVLDTNEFVEKAGPVERGPKEVLPERRHAVPDWVAEFNAETRDLSESEQEFAETQMEQVSLAQINAPNDQADGSEHATLPEPVKRGLMQRFGLFRRKSA